MSTRPRKTERLSDAARRIVGESFSKGRPAAAVAAEVLAQTGENVSARTITRARSDWEMERRRRQAATEQADDLMAAALKHGASIDAIGQVRALTAYALTQDPERYMALDPIDVQRTGLQAEKVAIQREQLELRKRQQTLEEQRFEIARAREQRAIAALEDHDAVMTPEDRIQKIREIYGLAS